MTDGDRSRIAHPTRTFAGAFQCDPFPWQSMRMREYAESGGGATTRADLDHLFSITYEELKRLASAVRRRDPAASITPTALVNEAWLKLAQTPQVANTSPLHFRRIAARAMRQVLIEAARRRMAGKRDATGWYVTFDVDTVNAASDADALIALDDAIHRLATLSPRQAMVVEARFFGGLSVPDTAQLLAVSESTVMREWRLARAWLARELGTGR